MAADQRLRCAMHRLGVQRDRHAPGMSTLQRQVRPAVDDAVEITAPGRIEACVEAWRRIFGRQDGYRMGPQVRIQGVAHGVGAQGFLQVEMGDLAKRMDAGIRAACTDHQDRRAIEREGGILDSLLHRRRAFLALPSSEGGPIVFQRELISRHGYPSRLGAPSKAAGKTRRPDMGGP